MSTPSILESEVARMVPEPRASTLLARIVLGLVVLTAAALAFAPWRQSAPGKGRVVAYSPDERQQVIEAPVDGRVVRWFVGEGSVFAAGDPLVDLADVDPDILVRLAAERAAVVARLEAARARRAAIDDRVRSMQGSERAGGQSADERALMARERERAAIVAVDAAKAAAEVARLNLERQKGLFGRGLAARRAVEVAEAEAVRTRTDVERAEAVLSAARAEVSAFGADRDKVRTDARAAVNDALASRAAAEGEIAAAEAELARLEVRISRQETQHVRAPFAGTVLRIVTPARSQFVKAGDPLLVLVPSTDVRAVELWVAGNDVNLVRPGQPARIQFEGWPAVQFSGWPSLAVGTYEGAVAFVEPADDGQGRFRVVVTPAGDARWPDPAYLRQGTRVSAWVLLEEVRLGYELWRQFNGFPQEWTGSATVDSGGKK